MSIVKRGFNNIFWIGISEISSKGLTFLGTIYLARILGKAGFGLFSLALTVGVYLWTIADVGVAGYGVREIARNREKTAELYSILNSLRFVMALCLFLIFSGALYVIHMPLEKKLILLSGGIYPIASVLSSDWVFRGLEKMKYIVVGGLTTSLFFVGNILLFVKGYSDTTMAVLLYSSSFLAGSLISMIFLRHKLNIPFSFLVSFKDWRFHIKESFYFAINSAFNNILLFIPILFMGLWSTAEDLGVFSAPHRLMTLIARVGGISISALYPVLASLYITDRDAFKRTHLRFQKVIIGIAIPFCIIATIYARDIIVLFYGTLYLESAHIFAILVWLAFLYILRNSFGNALASAGFHRFNMFATGTGVVVVTISSAAFIPKYSGYGSVYALIAGEIVTFILSSTLIRAKIYQNGFLKLYTIKILVASMITGFFVKSLPFPVIQSIILGICVYGALLFGIGIVNKKHIQQIYKVFFIR